ncbi:MAG: hypothetical protein SF069_12940 [Phycisphaerae bacterium]|nr:hypothetical protein [Phycisphaerae bacterium]
MTKEVERFAVVDDKGREFVVIVWQEFEPQRFGRGRTRNYPTIQNLETTEGHFVRKIWDGRYEIPALGLTVSRVESAQRA